MSNSSFQQPRHFKQQLGQGISLYFHLPFCRSACSYCDFYFVVSRSREEEFFEALKKELKIRIDRLFLEAVQPPYLRSIYFGGGTPSFIEPEGIAGILELVLRGENRFEISNDLEVTLEANPEDLSEERLAAYHQMGINRLSIGVQSFRNEDLRYLGRQSSPDLLDRLGQLKSFQSDQSSRSGWKNWSLDLIYGMPTLTPDDWQKNLEQAIGLSPVHLSLYGLTVEPGTALAYRVSTGRKEGLVDDQLADQFEQARSFLAAHNFDQYEISNYCRQPENNYSQHNLGYWLGGAYWGLGPSAHSLVINKDGSRERVNNFSNLGRYLESLKQNTLPEERREGLSYQNLFNERVLTELRMKWGIDLNALEVSFLRSEYVRVLEQAKEWIDSGHLQLKERYLVLTPTGRLMADRISASFFI